VTAALCAAGLALSGSRSGFLVAGLGLAFLIFSAGRIRRRLAVFAAGIAVLAVVAAAALRGAPGNTGARLSELLDPSLPAEYRTSSRALLWHSAVRLFGRHPVEGAGLGAFSWQLPDLLAEEGRSLPVRDNPGNACLQALAESGAIGFLRPSPSRPASRGSPSGRTAPGSRDRLLIALAIGSHWFAPDVSWRSSCSRPSPPPRRPRRSWMRREDAARPGLPPGGGARGSSRCTPPPRSSRASRRCAPTSPSATARIGFHEKEVGPGGPFY
jgi:hypothetical protein